MADGSPEDRAGPTHLNVSTFSAPDSSHGDSKKCSGLTFDGDRVKLSFYTEQETSDSCEKSESSGVAADRPAAVASTDSRKSPGTNTDDGDDRKKRCFDRYDSSESSDSGVAVLSPTESGGCSGSDITEPRSPRSPESACSTTDEGAGGRMPPWANDPAPGPRRLAAQPAPVRRPNPHIHRRITEYFNHKMKPQNGVKRDSNAACNDDAKKKCLLKNGVTHDLEKYISYLSQTLSPKVLMDVGRQTEELRKPAGPLTNDSIHSSSTDLNRTTCSTTGNGILEFCKPRENNHTRMHNLNGFMEVRHASESCSKEKNAVLNGFTDSKKVTHDVRTVNDPSANISAIISKVGPGIAITKVAIPASSEITSLRIPTSTSVSISPKKKSNPKSDLAKMNGVVSSTTKLDSRMNGVMCGSNNLSLNTNIGSKPTPNKREPAKKNTQPKRTNRKSSACIANSKNLTWSKANNLKQVQLQKQNCLNSVKTSSAKSLPGEAIPATPKLSMPNGIRQVSMTMNGNLNNLNAPVTNFQNCHTINMTQPCNGTVTSNNFQPSFVAVPQNVMLTTLRIPQNGIPPQAINQQNNMATFNRSNVNVASPTKLNGQFMFPLMQNLNGTVVQIPNIMTKMPNFVLPQSSQLTAQRQDHLQNQILINGTILKLANPMTTYQNVNKTGPVTSQQSPMNKTVTGIPTVGMTVQSKPNYTVNLSHPVYVPQPGYIVTSVPNMNVKETWSYTSTNPTTSPTCSSQIVHHPTPLIANFATQALHTSSIPIAPVKPPDNPIQGTDPPSSTVEEPEFKGIKIPKCDIPWLSKTVNNNIVPLDSNKITSRPFAEVSSLTEKIEIIIKKEDSDNTDDTNDSDMTQIKVEIEPKKEIELEEFKKIEEVARREDTIFTQITVLKDVTSDVQNTVIEANFSSATTESSESGIGTDKSIDSPSDSQTSKECDEDSSLSLSISVSSVEAQSCQKSPILKQPKTLRFPPRNLVKSESDQRTSSTDTTPTLTVCLWENCKREFETDTDLIDHLLVVHVEAQAGQQNYVCLWEQCKVRGKPSCSRLWLERHTSSHGGNKPFKCIVDGCDRRFSTQILLERHVNNHFSGTSGSAGGRRTSDSANKLIRRNGKKLRYRRQPWSARMFDFFDAGTMEGLVWRLLRCTRWRLGGASQLREPPGRHTLTLHAALRATRYNALEARREALLTYYPPHVIDDEWVPEKDVKRIKRVEIAELPVHTKVLLYEQFCSSYQKAPAPPPPPARPAPAPPAPPAPAQPSRVLPARSCTSSRLLNNLIAKQKRAEAKTESVALTNYLVYKEEEKTEKVEVSGAKKRKLGRRYGGNSFWPSGR